MMRNPYQAGGSGNMAAGAGPAEQHRWQRRYAGRLPALSKAVRQLQDENARLRKLVAELRLDKAILRDVARLCCERQVGAQARRA